MEKLKAYISGPITGQEDKAIERFQAAEKELIEMGFEPVNPFKNGLPSSSSWDEQIAKDVESILLLPCQIVYFLRGWQTSRGCRIEYSTALNAGRELMFESVIENDRMHEVRDLVFVEAVKGAIHEVMKADFPTFVNQHNRDGFFARMIFCWHCKEQGGMSIKQIAQLIRRDYTTILYCLKKYEIEFNYNVIFNRMANRVKELLSSFPYHRNERPETSTFKKMKSNNKNRKRHGKK